MKRLSLFMLVFALGALNAAANQAQQYCADVTGSTYWNGAFSETVTGPSGPTLVTGVNKFYLTQDNTKDPPAIGGTVNYFCGLNSTGTEIWDTGTVNSVGSSVEGSGQFFIEWNASSTGLTEGCPGTSSATIQIPLGTPGCDSATVSSPDYYTSFTQQSCLVPPSFSTVTSYGYDTAGQPGIAHWTTKLANPSTDAHYNWQGRVVTGALSGQINYPAQCSTDGGRATWAPLVPFTGPVGSGYSGTYYVDDNNWFDEWMGWINATPDPWSLVQDVRIATPNSSLPCGIEYSEKVYLDCPTSAGGPTIFGTATNYMQINNEHYAIATIAQRFDSVGTAPADHPFGSSTTALLNYIYTSSALGAALGAAEWIIFFH